MFARQTALLSNKTCFPSIQNNQFFPSENFIINSCLRIVDPETALNMLHKAAPNVPAVGVPSFAGPPPAGAGPLGPGRPVGGRPDLQRDPMRMEPRLSNDGPPPFNPDTRPPFNDDIRRDPRNRDPRERSNGMPNLRNPPPPMSGGNMNSEGPPPRGGPPPALPPHLAGADPEKAQLIMQVLQLTDEQIAMLPPQQRESIMVLKEQINQGPR